MRLDIEIQAMTNTGVPKDVATGWVIKALERLKNDDKLKILAKEALYQNQAKTFLNSEYVTAELLDDVLLYRRFGGTAKVSGSFVSTQAKLSRRN